MHKILVHECFRDRRPGGMWGLGLGTFCGHIAVQVPMMHFHQWHALVSVVPGLDESHHGCQTFVTGPCQGVASIATFDVAMEEVLKNLQTLYPGNRPISTTASSSSSSSTSLWSNPITASTPVHVRIRLIPPNHNRRPLSSLPLPLPYPHQHLHPPAVSTSLKGI